MNRLLGSLKLVVSRAILLRYLGHMNSLGRSAGEASSCQEGEALGHSGP